MSAPTFTLGKYMSKPSGLTKPSLMMVMGPYGGGKTYFSASASLVPELRKVLIVDLEGSTTGTVSDFDDEHLHIIDIQKQARGANVHPVVFFEAVMDQVFDHPDEYNTVVIDTLDVLNNMYLEYYENNSPMGSSGGRDGFYKWTETRKNLTSHNGLIAQMRAAPFMAVLVMHEEVSENTGAFEFAWTGKGAKSELGQFPDIIMRVNRKYNQKKNSWSTEILTVPTERGQSKSRFNKIPEVIDADVTMADIWKMLSTKKVNNKEEK